MIVDSSIHEKNKLREKFDISEEGKELHSLKSIRRKDNTPITQMSVDIYNRDLKIDKLNNKRERFSNDGKEILKGRRKDRNRTKFGLEDRIMLIASNVSYKTRSLVWWY